jgi:hypothetical protein
MKWADYEALTARVAKQVGDGVSGLLGGKIGFGKTNLIRGASGFPHQIDVSVDATSMLLIVECKCWQHDVTPEAVLSIIARRLDIADHVKSVVAVLATVKGFGPGAQQLAKHFGVELWHVTNEQEFVARALDVISLGVVSKSAMSDHVQVRVVGPQESA